MNLDLQLNAIRKRFRNSSDVTITQGFLRSDAALGTQNTIKFPVLSTETSADSVQSRLNISDAFVVTHAKVTVYKVTDANNTIAGRQRAIHYTYLNSTIFDGTNDANVNAIFSSGKFFINLNRNTLLSGLDVSKFERVPTTQQGTVSAAANDNGTPPATTYQTYPIARDGKDNGLYGYYPLFPMFNFGGNDTVDFNIQLPEAVNMDETGEVNYCSLWLNGWLVQNGAQFRDISGAFEV